MGNAAIDVQLSGKITAIQCELDLTRSEAAGAGVRPSREQIFYQVLTDRYTFC